MEENLFPEAELAAGWAGQDGVPASGVITGIVLGMSASLLVVAADRSRPQWPGAPGAVAQAEALRRRAGMLARNNSQAYDYARTALAGGLVPPGTPEQRDWAGTPEQRDWAGTPEQRDWAGTPEQRDWAIGRAVAAAADPPLALAGCADDVAHLALALAEHGCAEVRADVVAAAQLAAGAAASAAHLVEVNLVVGANEARTGQAYRHARSAAEAARAAAAS